MKQVVKKFLGSNLSIKKLTNITSLINTGEHKNLMSIIKCNFGAKKKISIEEEKPTKKPVKKSQSPPPTSAKKNKKPEKKEAITIDEASEEEIIEVEEEEIKPSKQKVKKTVASNKKVESKAPTKAKSSNKKTSNAKIKQPVEEVEKEEEEKEDIEVEIEPKISHKKKVISKQQKPVEEKHTTSIFKIDIDKNPQDLGKLPLSDEFPLKVSDFPFNLNKTKNPYDNYIKSNRISAETRKIIDIENNTLCQNYAPIPIVINKSRGFILEDIDGYKYVDCLTGYGCVAFGHSNGEILKQMISQLTNLQITSRAVYNNRQYEAAKLVTEIFRKEKCIFMNSGVEAGETALKLARRWGYRVKKIPSNQAKVVYMKNNFWGRTTTACGTSDDPSRYLDFGPYDNGSYLVEYNNISELQKLLESDPNICAVMAEPIQGEAGFIIPSKDYLMNLSLLCKKHNVLYLDDEVQAGIGRSGKILATEYSMGKENLPDIIILGKALSNGCYPVSCVLANKEIIDVIGPGEHGSTYSGNPLAMSAVIASLNILKKDNFAIVNHAYNVGGILSVLLFQIKSKFIKEIRGRGLMIGIEFKHDIPIDASDICLLLLERGLVTKPTHKYNIRIAPPLNITYEEAAIIYEILNFVLTRLDNEYPNYQNNEPAKVNVIIEQKHIDKASEYLSNRFDNPITYKKQNPLHNHFKKQISLNLSGSIENVQPTINTSLFGINLENNSVPNSLDIQLSNQISDNQQENNKQGLSVFDQLNHGNKI